MDLAPSLPRSYIKAWSIKGGELLWSSCAFDNHLGRVNKLAVCEEENMLFSCGDDTTVRAWDIANGALLWESLPHLSHSFSVLDLSVGSVPAVPFDSWCLLCLICV